MNCPHCGRRISDKLIARYLATKGGSAISEAKAAASRNNGRLGGRPRKTQVDSRQDKD